MDLNSTSTCSNLPDTLKHYETRRLNVFCMSYNLITGKNLSASKHSGTKSFTSNTYDETL